MKKKSKKRNLNLNLKMKMKLKIYQEKKNALKGWNRKFNSKKIT